MWRPKPLPPPPLVIGVKGDKALRLAAQYGDWWNVSDAPIDVMRTRMALLDFTHIGGNASPHHQDELIHNRQPEQQ